MEDIADCFSDQKVCSSVVKSHRDSIVLKSTQQQVSAVHLAPSITKDIVLGYWITSITKEAV